MTLWPGFPYGWTVSHFKQHHINQGWEQLKLGRVKLLEIHVNFKEDLASGLISQIIAVLFQIFLSNVNTSHKPTSAQPLTWASW